MDREMEERIPMPEIGSAVFECESVEEAREKAAELWGIKADDIEARIISEEKKLFGILGCTYKVEVRPFAPVTFIKSCHFVNEILEKMDLDLIPELDEDGTINLVGEDVGVVIGRYGETLKAEYLTNLACHDDILREGYVSTADTVSAGTDADKACRIDSQESLRKGTPVSLEPMSSWERRIVHALRDSKEVETKSIGEEPSRRVLVCPVARQDREVRRKEKIFPEQIVSIRNDRG